MNRSDALSAAKHGHPLVYEYDEDGNPHWAIGGGLRPPEHSAISDRQSWASSKQRLSVPRGKEPILCNAEGGMSNCCDCAYFAVIGAIERCKRVPMIDANGNPCFGASAFMRDPIGVYGEPHCGPQGKLWRER